MSRPRSFSSPVKVNGKIKSRPVTPFSSIPEEEEHSETSLSSSLSSLKAQQIPRHPHPLASSLTSGITGSNSKLTTSSSHLVNNSSKSNPNLNHSLQRLSAASSSSNIRPSSALSKLQQHPPSASSSTSSLHRPPSSTTTNPKAPPRPQTTIMNSLPRSKLSSLGITGKKTKSQQQALQILQQQQEQEEQQKRLEEDEQLERQQQLERQKKLEEEEEERERQQERIEKMYQHVTKSNIFRQAVEALEEMQSSLLSTSFQAILWESEARESEKLASKMKDQRKRERKIRKERDLSRMETLDLLESTLRESIRSLTSS